MSALTKPPSPFGSPLGGHFDAVRALLYQHILLVNAGTSADAAALFADPANAAIDPTVRSISIDPGGDHDRVGLLDDGRAVTTMRCTVEIERPIEPPCPLIDMARAQGGGTTSHPERRLLRHVYAKRGDTWTIEKVSLLPFE